MDLIDLTVNDIGTDTFEPFLEQICHELGFDFAAYAGRDIFNSGIHGFVNYPEGWKQHYLENGLHRIDPTLHSAQKSIAPVDWVRLKKSPEFEAVFAKARDFRIPDQGITIPVRGPYGDIGLLSVTRECSRDEWQKLKRANMPQLQQLAVHIHDAVMSSSEVRRALGPAPLSAREKETLQWAAVGKTQQDIADILGISSRTVEVHLRSCRDKLHALTTVQAVARAIRLRLVTPD